MRLCLYFVLTGAALAQSWLPPPEVTPPLRLEPSHPRLSFRPAAARGAGRTVESVRALYHSNAAFRSIFDAAVARVEQSRDPAEAAAVWTVTAQERAAVRAARLLEDEPITRTGDGRYSNLWSFALAWDWLYGHPALADARERIAARIAERLDTELDWLDDRGMALWHGRNQAANGAMVAALALGDRSGGERRLARAAAHYVQALRALRFSEGWPEGPSYWIYNRAAPYALAADCFITATGTDAIAGIRVRDLMRTIGLWSLYQFGPNRVFEPYGDSAGSLRLGETGWWEITADYFARLSQDPDLAAGGDWFRKLSPTPYGRPQLRWWAALSFEPPVRPAPGYDPSSPERWLRDRLAQARLFGRSSMGVAFFRGEWGDPDELFASFKAGDLLAHHDHYDAGHFSIQYGGLLAPLTGIYNDPGGYNGAYRLGYAVQTVAANSLLILAPGETSARLRALKDAPWTALSGGQRVILPTGFDCASLEHFEALRESGPHLRRARIQAFASAPGRWDYIAADITPAYNSTLYAEPGALAKVSLVTRQFLYLRPERAFVIYDRVETTRPSFVPKFLLHSLSKPATASERQLAGNSASDGILESSDRSFSVAHGRGVLTAYTVLPERARILKIGGPNYYAYVESGGDQSAGFQGVRLSGGDPAQPRDTKQLGLWRAEIEPAAPGTGHRFLTVLLPRLVRERGALPPVETVAAGEAAHAVRVGGTVAVFARTPGALAELTLAGGKPSRLIVLDAAPGRRYSAGPRRAAADPEGVLEIELPEGVRTIRMER